MSAADAARFFDGARLTMARQLAGLRKSELAQAVGRSATIIANWESGHRPTPANLAALAVKLGVEPEFFAVTNGGLAVPTTTPHFRSLRSTTQQAREQAQAFGQLAVDIATGLERHVEFPKNEVIYCPLEVVPPEDCPERAAWFMRGQWELADGPIRHVLRLMETHGVLVVFSPPQAASVDAYSFDSAQRSVVVLNPLKRDYYRQRFDLAHELGHLVMHPDAEPGGRLVEEQANRFASELLMPEAEIVDELPSSMSVSAWQQLAALKERWGVSIQALLFRARQLGRLSDVSYRNAMMTVSARGWRRSEPRQIHTLEQPSLLPRAVQLLAEEGFDEKLLARQCRAPLDLFRIVTSRIPGAEPDDRENKAPGPARRNVVSLLAQPR